MFQYNGFLQALDNIEVQVLARARVPVLRAFYSRRAIDRLFKTLGSTSNPHSFTLLQGNVNGMKGRVAANLVAANLSAISHDRIEAAVRAAEAGDDTRFGEIFGFLRQVSAHSHLRYLSNVCTLIHLGCV
jgi:hypothetical protein